MALPVIGHETDHLSATGRRVPVRKCICERHITFYGGDERCPGCSALYNGCGQRLRDPAPNLETDLNDEWLH